MRRLRSLGGFTGAMVAFGTLLLIGTSISQAAPGRANAHRWAQESLTGTHVFKRQVPVASRPARPGTSGPMRPPRG